MIFLNAIDIKKTISLLFFWLIVFCFQQVYAQEVLDVKLLSGENVLVVTNIADDDVLIESIGVGKGSSIVNIRGKNRDIVLSSGESYEFYLNVNETAKQQEIEFIIKCKDNDGETNSYAQLFGGENEASGTSYFTYAKYVVGAVVIAGVVLVVWKLPYIIAVFGGAKSHDNDIQGFYEGGPCIEDQRGGIPYWLRGDVHPVGFYKE